MPKGYFSNGAPDPGWWMEQINAALEYRKKFANEDMWDEWRRYYRGQWDRDILPVNVTFSHLRSMVPRVYFRNPSVSVTPARAGFLDMAFAEVVNKLDNLMLQQMAVKQELKMMVQDAFLFGTAIGKLGFSTGETQRERVDYDHTMHSNMPWFRRVPPGEFLVPDGSRDFRDMRWVAHWMQRSKDDVAADKRLNQQVRHDLPATKTLGGSASIEQPVDMVDLVEIRDAKTQKVILLAPFGDGDQPQGKVLLVADDIMQAPGLGFNMFPVIFNPDDEVFWGVSDVKILEPQQLERNEIRTQMMKHRRLLLVKLLVRRGKITESEAVKMVSEDVGPIVYVDGDPDAAVSKLQISNIPTDLIVADREVGQDIRETLGFSRNQLGELQSRRGDTSATEAKIVSDASEIRIDERRDIIADVLVRMVKMMNDILFDRWEGEQVAEVVGPGGAQIWVTFNPRDLGMGHYNVKVDPDSSTPRTRGLREAKAVKIYEILKSNPFVDPEALTRFLLNELEGVEVSDLMRALPPPQQQPNGPVGLPEFAGMLQQGVRSVQNGARPRLGAG